MEEATVGERTYKVGDQWAVPDGTYHVGRVGDKTISVFVRERIIKSVDEVVVPEAMDNPLGPEPGPVPPPGGPTDPKPDQSLPVPEEPPPGGKPPPGSEPPPLESRRKSEAETQKVAPAKPVDPPKEQDVGTPIPSSPKWSSEDIKKAPSTPDPSFPTGSTKSSDFKSSDTKKK